MDSRSTVLNPLTTVEFGAVLLGALVPATVAQLDLLASGHRRQRISDPAH